MNFLEIAIRDKLVIITEKGSKKYITYTPDNHTEIFSDPEEQVRAEFWSELIYRYQYDPALIGIEITVPDRTPSDRADLIIFKDKDRKRPYAVIECKKEGISDSEFDQAIEQACGNGTWAKFRASYVMVVAGRTRRAFDFTGKYGVLEREKNIVADLPIRYGKPQEFKFYKGTELDIQPVSKAILISAIRKCHQTLWGGGRLSPPTAFSELCKIIFVKINDEKKKRKSGSPYQFQIKTHESSNSLAKRIKELYGIEQVKDPDVFTDTVKIDDTMLLTVVSHLESINLSQTDLDVKGLAFEQFMDGFFKGDFGQYFTPREIIDFMINVMEPTNEDIVLDPACGSGGFLLHTLDAVRKEASEYYDDKTVEHYKHWHNFAKENIFGIEINDEIARVAKMNMIIHDDGHSNIIGFDALKNESNVISVNTKVKDNTFCLIITNPPFGAKIKRTERPYLSEYYFGQKLSGTKTTIRSNQRIEVLFIERIWRFLLPKVGRAAVILPDSILTNESQQYVRDWLLQGFQIYGITSLPEHAFSHFGTGVKTSILFLRKRDDEEVPDDNEKIILCTPKNIGYDATGRKTENELPLIANEIKKCFDNSTYEPRIKYTETKARDIGGIDQEVLLLLGIKKYEKPISNVFIIDKGLIDGPLNPERYKALWIESLFDGQCVTDVADVLDEKYNPSKFAPSCIFDLIRIDDLKPNPIKVDTIRTMKGCELEGTFFEVKENDILFARLGPTILNRKVVICPKTKNSTLASPEFLVLRAKNGHDPKAILSIFRTKLYLHLMYSKSRGSTPSRYRVSRNDLIKAPFPNIEMISSDLSKMLSKRMNIVEKLLIQAALLWE